MLLCVAHYVARAFLSKVTCTCNFSVILHLSFRRRRRERIGGLKPTLPLLKEIIKEIRGGGKKKIIGALLLFAADFVAGNHDTAICKSPLLRKGVRVVVPARFEQFREDIFSTGIRFGTHNDDFIQMR